MSSEKIRKPRVIFIGTPKFGAIVLNEIFQRGCSPILVITSSDKPSGRGLQISPSLVKEVALKIRVPILESKTIKSLRKEIREKSPDLILVAAFGEIIPKEILKIPRYGSLNLHPSLLPEYRGPSPIQQAIIDGVERTGVSLIQMTEKVDAGPIVAQKEVKLEEQMDYKKLEEKLAIEGAKLFCEVLPQWMKGEIEPQEQDEKKATYTKAFKKEDGRINWSEKAEVIERKIRAFQEWPKTFTFLDGERFIILEAETKEYTEGSPRGEPGKIYLAPDDKIAVQCKDSYLILKKIKPEGKKEMTIEDFLKGHIDIIGKKFQ